MLQKILSYLLPALRLQFFITLLAMPILVWWGLPISTLSIFGNLIFAPLLSLFLLLSSLIFFLELACLPNQWLIFILEKLTTLWLGISPSSPNSYLLLFPKITLLVFIFAILTASYIMIYLHLSKTKHVLILGVILVTSCAIAKSPIWVRTHTITLTHRHKQMQIDYHNRTLTLHDSGILNNYAGVESWINYTLIPTLIKTFGTITVKDLHLTQNTPTTIRNLEILKTNLIVETVFFKN